jgi:hypothetical protein
MQCRDVRELADSFLSGQLLVARNDELVRHLETCPACRADLEGRRFVRQKIRGALERAEDLRPRPEFAAELAAKLHPARSTLSRRSLLKSWWALAAGVAAAAGGGLVLHDSRTRLRMAAAVRAAAGDHQNCAVAFALAERPIGMEEAGRRFGAPYAALATFELPAVGGPLEAIERHACVYEGRRFGHVVLRFKGTLASLLVTGGDVPPVPALEPHERGPAVAAFPAGRFAGFVVADLDPADVLRLAEALAPALSRHLA